MITFAVVVETVETDLAVPGEPIFQVTGQRSEKTGWMEPVEPIDPMAMLLVLRQPVFHLGEIILLGDDDREVCGPMRKPDKWSVKVETFADVDAAVARAREVQAP